MKKLSVIFSLMFIFAVLLAPVSAFATEFVTDRDILLEPSQLNILEMRCNRLSEENFGLIICIEEDMGDTDQRIQELSVSSGYSMGAVFFVDSGSAVSYFKPYGKDVTEVFTDEIRLNIEQIANDKLTLVGYYEACRSVVANVESVLSGDGTLYDGLCYMPAIIDEAGYLTSSEEAELSAKIDSIRETYETDVAVVIEKEMKYSDAAQAAAEIYDYNFYGIGEESAGILLYISKNPRKYHFSFYPSYLQPFDGEGVAHLDDEVLPYLKSDDYYGAVNAYADTVEMLLSDSAGGLGYSDSEEGVGLLGVIIFGFPPALIIALIATFIRGRKMNTATADNYASNYVKEGSFNLTASNDIFMYSRIDKRARPKQNTTTHSSSGRSHGGRGGSY